MKNYTTEEQRNQIQSRIEEELLKRGIITKLIEFQEVTSRGQHYLEFSSEKFQTVPVLFKEIRVRSFSTSITEIDPESEESHEGRVTARFWIQVNISWTVFSRGTNGTNLFEVIGDLHSDGFVRFQSIQ